MFAFVLSLIFLSSAVLWYFLRPLDGLWEIPPVLRGMVGHLCLLLAVLLQLPVHFVMPGGREIMVLDRVYLGTDLQDGRLIATGGERGLQARTLPPGFQFEPFVGLIYITQKVPYTVVPEGHYGLVSARDGQALPEGSVIAPPVPAKLFMDAVGFMEGREIDGVTYRGTKGPQTTVLRPGAYPINTHLFKVEVDETTRATVVPNGAVAVIKSAVNEGRRPADMPTRPGEVVDCSRTERQTVGSVSVELVPVGCRGTWEEPLPPGTYFLNRMAYEVTLLETRTNVWTYAGGYRSSRIDLEMAADGSVTQERTPITVPAREDAAGNAVAVKVEGWTVHVDVRIQAQVPPDRAPATVAAVGNLEAVRDRFITPNLRSVLRNIGGGTIEVPNRVAHDEALRQLETLETELQLLRTSIAPDAPVPEAVATELRRLEADIADGRRNLPDPDMTVRRGTLVLDFIENRELLERLVTRAMESAGEDAGISIVGVKIGNVDIPAELLVARKREQLAVQFRAATIQERLAQVERIETEREKATADQQAVLVTEQIARERAAIAVERRADEGRAEQAYLEALAAGEQARVDVIGQSEVVRLRMLEAILEAIQEHPELVSGLNLPRTVVIGGDGGLEGASAILGATRMFGGPMESGADRR